MPAIGQEAAIAVPPRRVDDPHGADQAVVAHQHQRHLVAGDADDLLQALDHVDRAQHRGRGHHQQKLVDRGHILLALGVADFGLGRRSSGTVTRRRA
jgi:hypothetical protein